MSTTAASAAQAAREKREAEMAEMRRLRAQHQEEDGEVQLSAAELIRKKREEEMAALRNKSGHNEETRKRLQDAGGSLVTDMDAWRAAQLGAKDKDRQGKMDASAGLHNFSGPFMKNKTNAELGAEEDRKNKADAASNLRGHKGAFVGNKTQAEIDKEAQRESLSKMGKLSLDPSNEAEQPPPDMDDDEPTETVKEKAERVEAEERAQVFPELVAPPPGEAVPPPRVQYDISDANEEDEAPRYTLHVPTYSRVDIKFSFGLIVRSTAADGFNGENLRDNETLKKCMDGTMKILKEEMPLPPDVDKLLESSSATSFKVKFPQAYYDLTFEPNVISIEEDKKKQDDGKVTAKGNKRTLVKASFPVFMRDEADDGESQKRAARMLKETKTTVFKALRSAVSGGSFLR